MATRAIVTSAADSKFFPLLKGLVLSIRRAPSIAHLPMVVLDLGLGDADKAWLAQQNVTTIRIGWDIEFLASAGVAEYIKAQAWRPFLPRHLPEAEVYVWMDADTWIQDERAVLLAIECARREDAIAVVPEISRFYRTLFLPPRELRSAELAIYSACFGAEVANRLAMMPLINSGFFALARNSQVWSLWASLLSDMYRRSLNFYTEQTSLNYLIYARNLPFVSLPAYCNWIALHALPSFDETRGRLVEPGAPLQDIWIVHMAGPTKDGEHVLRTTAGKTVLRSLRFPETPTQPEASRPA